MVQEHVTGGGAIPGIGGAVLTTQAGPKSDPSAHNPFGALGAGLGHEHATPASSGGHAGKSHSHWPV